MRCILYQGGPRNTCRSTNLPGVFALVLPKLKSVAAIQVEGISLVATLEEVLHLDAALVVVGLCVVDDWLDEAVDEDSALGYFGCAAAVSEGTALDGSSRAGEGTGLF